MDEMDIIGLKLPSDAGSAAVIKLIRGYTEESIAVIKEHIASRDYVYYCDYTDTPRIRKVIKLYKELKQIGVTAVLYEEGEETTLELLKNLISSYDEIDKQKYD